MPLDVNQTRQYLKDFNFKSLFVEELGWDHYTSHLEVSVDGQSYLLTSIAQKRGMVTFTCSSSDENPIPSYPVRRKIESQVAKSIHEHLIIYTDKTKTIQVWQWVKREAGKPTQCREHSYYHTQPGDALIQKLQFIVFTLEDEERGPTIPEVVGRVRAGFDVDRVTKRFYDRFKSEHDTFLKFLKGIPDEEMQRWYASVMLNRLMFIYFIQKKSFLDDNINYLRDKLANSKQHGKDRFYKDFLCPLFFEGFAKKENERKAAINQLLGEVPFLNGGIFQPHQLEELYGKNIQIGDGAFEKLFNFFDQYQWHLDERPLRADNEINPDVLGYIFEKYINQKQMGAYYTKEDITEYISKNTVIPYLFDESRKKCKIAFEGDQSVWNLLEENPDRYIYDVIKHGITIDIYEKPPKPLEEPCPLPHEIVVGIEEISRRTEWNKPAPREYALPTEIWREVVTRRKRYEEVRTKLANGEIRDINDLITYNLNIRQFAQDVIENCEGPELLRAFWHAIEQVTVLDPACGSGAFLFAALNILEPLYEACLERMEVFLDELERSGEKHRPEKFGDFRKVLERIEKHPNRRYFIFKSIIVNNLYGVDIMEEAIEICKLRLFLKLVAQVEGVEHIEPLPDIDFNIRAGNTLVGYANYEEVKKAVLGDTQGKLDLGKDMQRIDEKAQDVDRLFKRFREQQTELGGEITPSDKQELRNRLKALENELNRYLAGEYSVEPNKKDAYAKWLNFHKPFHWFIEFYGIIHKQGGFDVIIGNPPYVEYRKVSKEYKLQQNKYVTESCGDIYACCMERSASLLSNSRRYGMIVPISAFSTEGFLPLQNVYVRNCEHIWVSNYADSAKLFTGITKRLSIVLSKHQKIRDASVFVTNYYKETDLKCLFGLLEYISPPQLYFTCNGAVPKISKALENEILKKLFLKGNSKLLTVLDRRGESLFFTRTLRNFCLFHREKPYRLTLKGEKVYASEIIEMKVRKDRINYILCVLNSNLFLWFYTVFSDMRHINKGINEVFPLAPTDCDSDQFKDLYHLLQRCLETSVIKRPPNDDGIIERYYQPRKCKSIIDEIDYVLAENYGFTDEEVDFIINYDIKYRMGRNDREEE